MTLGINKPDGFLQVVVEADSHRIIGTQIIGTDTSSLIAKASIAVQNSVPLGAIAHTPLSPRD